MEEKKNELDNPTQERDDSKDIITIDYFDRINHRWIKVDVTKEVARFMKADKQKTRRKQNQYNFYNLPFDEVFDTDKDDDIKNSEYLIDEDADFEKEEQLQLELAKYEHEKFLFSQAMDNLTDTQRVYTQMAFYENMTYQEIANLFGITKQSVKDVIKSATKNIKNYIQNTQN